MKVDYHIENNNVGVKLNLSFKPINRVIEANSITIIRNCIQKLEDLKE